MLAIQTPKPEGTKAVMINAYNNSCHDFICQLMPFLNCFPLASCWPIVECKLLLLDQSNQLGKDLNQKSNVQQLNQYRHVAIDVK